MTRRTDDDFGSFDDRGLDDSGVLTPRAAAPSWQVRSASASDAGDEPPRREVDSAGAPLSERGARRVFGALCVIACAAGRPGPGQRRELAEFQEFLGLSDAVARLLERQAARGGGTLRIGKRRAELEFLMGALIDVAAADGALSRVAFGLIDRVNERARWSSERLHDAIEAAVERAREAMSDRADDEDPLASASESGLFEATLLPSTPARRPAPSFDSDPLASALDSDPLAAALDADPLASALDADPFEATLLPTPARRPAPSFDDDPLDAALDDLAGAFDLADEPAAPTRGPAPLGLEDSGEGELLVLGSPWFERG